MRLSFTGEVPFAWDGLWPSCVGEAEPEGIVEGNASSAVRWPGGGGDRGVDMVGDACGSVRRGERGAAAHFGSSSGTTGGVEDVLGTGEAALPLRLVGSSPSSHHGGDPTREGSGEG